MERRLCQDFLRIVFSHLLLWILSHSIVIKTVTSAWNGSDVGVTLFHVRRLVTDLSVVGHHVVGDVTAEVESDKKVDVQILWTARIRENAFGPDSASYSVPIVGDSWCSIQETTWYSTAQRHVTSSLNCRHLPASKKSDDAGLTLVVKALEGAVQYQRNVDWTPTDGLDWRLPGDEFTSGRGPQRRRLVDVGYPIALNLSLLVAAAADENSTSNSSGLDSIRLSWVSDNTSDSYQIVLAPTTVNAVTGNGSSYDDGAASLNVTDGVVVSCRRTSPLVGWYQYTVVIDVTSASFHHAGTYTVEFTRGNENSRETVSFPVDLVVVGRRNADIDRPTATFRLRMRTCSNVTWSGAAQSVDFRLRSSVPDCVLCEASGRTGINVELYRADGLILGSEESHSVYWYRDSSLTYVTALLLRAPSDEYTGNYVCIASSLSSSARTSGFRKSSKPDVDKNKKQSDSVDNRRMNFSLTVQ